MQYRNAATILPLRLLREIQSYAGGELLYIPADAGPKTEWGARSGAKLRYRQRNAEIRSRYRNGETLGELAGTYFLSEDSIRKIVRHTDEPA